MTVKTVFLTSGTSWTVPSDCTLATIECIGGGGGGHRGATTTPKLSGGGGGGGAYSKATMLLTPGSTAYYSIGSGGTAQAIVGLAGNTGGDTWFNKNANSAPASVANGVLAKGGAGALADGSARAAGGASASCIGDAAYSGGSGGKGISGVSNGGGGGGGSAGSDKGAGGDGGNNTGIVAGTGGGGVGGAVVFNTTGGGLAYDGSAGGAGGSPGSAGTKGGGGGGGFPSNSGSGFAGGAGGPGAERTSSLGATAGAGGGGGGGGGGGDATHTTVNGGAGANGGLYGGGGGGGGQGQSGTYGTAGAGAQGIIIITYTLPDSGFLPFFDKFAVRVPGPSPFNTVLPVISGTAALGQTLSVSNGTWDYSPTSYAYQWRRDGVNIASATSSSYTLVSADYGAEIDCVVTATSADGSADAVATAVGPVSFNPATLFTGQAGSIYDVSDLSTLFQDSAGTTPAGVGDPVGYVADKSGNGNHLIQATTSKKPMLQQDGSGNYYLLFDGVDDTLSVASFSMTLPFDRLTATRLVTWTVNRGLWSGQTFAVAGLYLNPSSPSIRQIDGSATNTLANSDLAVGSNGVITERHIANASKLAVNNNAYVGPTDVGSTAPTNLWLGSQANAGFSNIRFYGAVLRTALTNGEIANVRTWLGSKCGLSL